MKTCFRSAAMAACLVLVTNSLARADLFTFSGSSGGQSVSATALVTVGNGVIDITLTNLQQNIRAASQEISGFSFAVTGETSPAVLTSSSGQFSNITSGGSYTNSGALSTLTHWGASNSVNLTTLTGGQPDQMIIGPDDHGGFNPTVGKYSNANASVLNFLPTVLGSGSFELTVAGVTANSVLSNVEMSFGTGPDAVLSPVVPPAVPEPSTMVIAGLGALGFVGYGLQRRLKK